MSGASECVVCGDSVPDFPAYIWNHGRVSGPYCDDHAVLTSAECGDDRCKFVAAIAQGQIATGASSRAMAEAVLGWRDGVGHAMPYDSGDWGRCLDTYLAAPKSLRERMAPIMELYYERLIDHTAKHGGDSWRLKRACVGLCPHGSLRATR